MLMSMMSAPLSALYFAASAIISGSAPAICTTRGSTSPSWLPRRMVFSEPHRREFDATISETAMPAPIFLQRMRKGRSVTPAMGATISRFRSWTGPILMGCFGEAPILYAQKIGRKLNFAQAPSGVADLLQKSSSVASATRSFDHEDVVDVHLRLVRI